MSTFTRRSRFAAAVLALFALSSGVHAQMRVSADTGSVIETSGFAHLTLPATSATIMLAVQARATTAAQASALNAPRVKKLLGALSASRPAPDSALVVGLAVGPNVNQERGTVIDYQSRAVIKLVVRQLDSLGRYLDIATGNGATEVMGITFNADTLRAAQRAAMAQAYGEAYANALALAAAAGGRLGPLLRLATPPGEAEMYVSEDRALLREGAGVPLAAQGVEVSASVTAVWRFDPRK